MPEFLSTEWIAALDRAARASPSLANCAGGDRFVIEQRIELGDGREAAHHFFFAAEGARVLPGRAEQADVVVTTDLRGAVALAQGTANAQQVLAHGGLRVGGDLEALGQRSEALGALDDLFAAVRATTTYPASEASEPPR